MVRLNLINKRGQVWSFDIVIAAAIFSVTLIMFYLYTVNNVPETEESVKTLSYDGGVITNILLSSGHPENWNDINVIELGLLSNDKINETKLEHFYNMSQSDFQRVKSLLNTPFDFYLFFEENMTINSMEIEGIGKPGINKDNIVSENLIKIERVVVYRNRPIGASLYIWN